MKKIFLVITILIISINSRSQDIKSKIIKSSELNNSRSLKIYIPPSYYLDSTRLYPLTIILDAEILFNVYVGNAILFAKTDEAPEQIIVGIDQNQYDERYEDCSYLKENSLPTVQGEEFINGIFVETGSFYSTTNDIKVTGSFDLNLDGVSDYFAISINGEEKIKVNNEGVLEMKSQDSTPTAVSGGMFYSGSNEFFLGFKN